MMKKEELDNLKKQAKELEDVLLGVNKEGISVVAGEEVLPKMKSISPLNYDVVKEESDRKASDIVESVILMYLPAEFVKAQDYVYQKMEVDKLTVSNLLFQMKTAEHAIMKLLEEIDSGSPQPRHFEVLASLQKSKMEIVKHLAVFIVTMEKNYKNLNYDWKNEIEKPQITLPEYVEEVEENTTKFRGTKSLMSMVQGYVEDAKKKIDGHFETLDDKQ